MITSNKTINLTSVEIRGLTLAEVEVLVKGFGVPLFRARQIFSWVHARGVTSTEEMTDLPKELRHRLAEQLILAPLQLDQEITAEDGTRKLRLRCADNAAIETVLIPDEGKLTQCLSSQVGCALGCRICATASMGFKRHLKAAEIVDQVYRARALIGDRQKISNLVFMGMGEPMNNLDNVLTAIDILCSGFGADFSSRRITVSTAGVVPGIIELGRRARQIGLAVSLNATTDEIRNQLMPINRRWPLSVLLEALRSYPLPRRRRITFEYVLIKGVNDSPSDAKRLPKLLDRIPAKINLIPYNTTRADSELQRPTDEEVELFAERLRDKDLPTYVRRSRGNDIAAACGQLIVSP